jgi:hypothetical protein
MVQGKATVNVVIERRCRPLRRCNSSFPSGPGRLDPCRMAGRELFKKLNPEKKQEQKLCLFCFKHKADQDCFVKARPDYTRGARRAAARRTPSQESALAGGSGPPRQNLRGDGPAQLQPDF